MTEEAKLAEEALRVLRLAAADRLPVDAGYSGWITDLIRQAWQGGRLEATEELAHAYLLYVQNDDLDVLRDAFTERLPEDWVAPEPGGDLTP